MASWAQKIRAHSASKQPTARKPRPVIHSTWAQTRLPNEETGDPGAVIDIHYTLEANAVTLTDAKGRPIGDKVTSYVLQPGDAAARIASRLALAAMERAPAEPSDGGWIV
jgi:hypothetical protein